MKIDNWKICHWPILAVYLKDFFCRQGQSQEMRILQIDNYDHCCFCNHDSTHFSILRVSANALYDYYSRIFDSFIFIHKSNRFFSLVKGYCVYMINKIIHGCLSLLLLNSKRNSISARAHVLFSISQALLRIPIIRLLH